MRLFVVIVLTTALVGCHSSRQSASDYTSNSNRSRVSTKAGTPVGPTRTNKSAVSGESGSAAKNSGSSGPSAETGVLDDVYAKSGESAGSGSTAAAKTLSFSDNVIRNAQILLGSNYRYGGTSPERGFDCSGFTSYVYRACGITLPRTSSEQSKAGRRKSVDQARAGDLIFFGTGSRVTHVGIVSSSAKNQLEMIHSSSSGGVRTDAVLSSPYWKSRVLWVVSSVQ